MPEHFVANLFSRATTIRLKADEVLFLAGDAGDGCYRVEDGLLKVMMMSRAGSERILAFLGTGAALAPRTTDRTVGGRRNEKTLQEAFVRKLN